MPEPKRMTPERQARIARDVDYMRSRAKSEDEEFIEGLFDELRAVEAQLAEARRTLEEIAEIPKYAAFDDGGWLASETAAAALAKLDAPDRSG